MRYSRAGVFLVGIETAHRLAVPFAVDRLENFHAEILARTVCFVYGAGGSVGDRNEVLLRSRGEVGEVRLVSSRRFCPSEHFPAKAESG